jgi:hypothetical protein
MQVDLETGEGIFKKEIIEELPAIPGPISNTVATIIRILTNKEFEDKGFLGRSTVTIHIHQQGSYSTVNHDLAWLKLF